MILVASALALTLAQAAGQSDWMFSIKPEGWRLLASSADAAVLVRLGPDQNPPKHPSAWVRIEYRVPVSGIMSRTALTRFDCVDGTLTENQVSGFPGRNMTGIKTRFPPTGIPQAYPRTSVMSIALREACKGH